MDQCYFLQAKDVIHFWSKNEMSRLCLHVNEQDKKRSEGILLRALVCGLGLGFVFSIQIKRQDNKMSFQKSIKSIGENGVQVSWTDPTYPEPSHAFQQHVDS